MEFSKTEEGYPLIDGYLSGKPAKFIVKNHVLQTHGGIVVEDVENIVNEGYIESWTQPRIGTPDAIMIIGFSSRVKNLLMEMVVEPSRLGIYQEYGNYFVVFHLMVGRDINLVHMSKYSQVLLRNNAKLRMSALNGVYNDDKYQEIRRKRMNLKRLRRQKNV